MESKVKLAGHPLHPMLIVFPLGLLGTAVIFDIVYLISDYTRWAVAAYYMIGAGIVGGLAAALFGWILARDGAGVAALQLLLSVTDSPGIAMLILILFFFLLGTFLEPVPALIITVPVMQPIIGHLGYDPVHFGIVVIMMLVVGSVTPPVGILAMVASRIAGVEYRETLGMLMPYTLAWVAVVLLVAFSPWMVWQLERLRAWWNRKPEPKGKLAVFVSPKPAPTPGE